MIIVDYSKDFYGNTVETKTFKSKIEVIAFAAANSQYIKFKIHRINGYKYGKLTPYYLEVNKGRIILEDIPQEGKSE